MAVDLPWAPEFAYRGGELAGVFGSSGVNGAQHLLLGGAVGGAHALHPAAELRRVQGGVKHGRTMLPVRAMGTSSGPGS